MDGDGRSDTADIPRLLHRLSEGFDVVSGWREQREDSARTRRLPSIIPNGLISALLHVPLHDYGCTSKVYRREVVEDVRLCGEMHRLIPIFAALEGARLTEMSVTPHPRRFGNSKYGLGRIPRVMLDLLIVYFIGRAFDRPIQFFGKVGHGFLGLSVITFGWAVVLKYAFTVSLIQTPLPPLAVVIGLSGVLFLMLGVMAEVQIRIYFEARAKPPCKMKRVVQHSSVPRLRAASHRW